MNCASEPKPLPITDCANVMARQHTWRYIVLFLAFLSLALAASMFRSRAEILGDDR